MKRFFYGFVLMLAGFGGSAWAFELPQPLAESEFVSLFDGKTLKGWRYADARKGYYATNGVLVCTRQGGNLFSEKEYGDFVLRLEFKLSPGGNNGIAIRAPMKLDKAKYEFPANEIQILDDTAKKHANLEPTQYCGALYKVFPARRGFLKPTGEWNAMEVTAVGPHIRVDLNGTKIVDGDIDSLHDTKLLKSHPGLECKSGHVGFMGHREPVEFRNIRICEINGGRALPK